MPPMYSSNRWKVPVVCSRFQWIPIVSILLIFLLAPMLHAKKGAVSPSYSTNASRFHLYRDMSHLQERKPERRSGNILTTRLKRAENFGFDIDETKANRITFTKNTTRNVIGSVLDFLSLKNGVEVGVQKGRFSQRILKHWKSCEKYVLVDLWGPQENYLDFSNVQQSVHEDYKRTALSNVERWKEKIEVCHNYSAICAERFESSSFDYAFVDARHDYQGVMEDLEAWYPKVRVGGVISGHDYADSLNVRLKDGQNWNIQADGSVDYSAQAVKGAVNLFFALRDQYISWPDWHLTIFRSWVVLKSNTGNPNDIFHFIDLSCMDGAECSPLAPEKALRISQWENSNTGCITLVWTSDLLLKYFPNIMKHYWTTYQNRNEAFEDFAKMHILHKFGGLFVDFSLKPIGGLGKYIRSGISEGMPFAFCGLPDMNDCKRVSTLVVGAPKRTPELLQMAALHQMLFSRSRSAKNMNRHALLSDMLRSSRIAVVRASSPFPTHPCDSKPVTTACVTEQLRSV